jgi:hypothetical protein
MDFEDFDHVVLMSCQRIDTLAAELQAWGDSFWKTTQASVFSSK